MHLITNYIKVCKYVTNMYNTSVLYALDYKLHKLCKYITNIYHCVVYNELELSTLYNTEQ